MDYSERLKTFDQETLNKKVYRLCGEDVISVLEDNGLLQKLTNKQVVKIIDSVERRLEIPWDEYIETIITEMISEGKIVLD